MKTTKKWADRTCRLLPSGSTKIASLHFSDNAYSLHCLTSVEHIQEIQSEWVELELKSSEHFGYFQSFDWCYQWCLSKLAQDIRDREAALRIYALRSKEGLVMIWPMMELKTRIGAKILTFLTDPLAQYSNILVDRAIVSEEMARAIWSLICKHTDADAITADRYPSGSILEAVLCDVGFAEKSINEASILDLTTFETWEEHHASLSRNQRKQRNRRKNKLSKQGELTYEVNYGDGVRYEQLVTLALDMKLEWLKNTGRSAGVLAQADTKMFLTNLSGIEQGPNGHPKGAVAQALCVDNEPIAIEIGMVMDRHYYSYLGAFDWSWSDYSPGKVQIESAQKWAKSVGLAKFDFLGDPADYKEQWTGTTHPMLSRSIPKTALGYLYCAVWKSRLRPQLKNVYKNMGSDRRKLSWQVIKVARQSADLRNTDQSDK